MDYQKITPWELNHPAISEIQRSRLFTREQIEYIHRELSKLLDADLETRLLTTKMEQGITPEEVKKQLDAWRNKNSDRLITDELKDQGFSDGRMNEVQIKTIEGVLAKYLKESKSSWF